MFVFLIWPKLAKALCEHCAGVETSSAVLSSTVVVVPAVLIGLVIILRENWQINAKQAPVPVSNSLNQAKRRLLRATAVTSIQQSAAKPQAVTRDTLISSPVS